MSVVKVWDGRHSTRHNLNYHFDFIHLYVLLRFSNISLLGITLAAHIIYHSAAMSATNTSTPPDEELPDERAEMPLTMAASVVLDQLPRDAHSALEHAGELVQAKSE